MQCDAMQSNDIINSQLTTVFFSLSACYTLQALDLLLRQKYGYKKKDVDQLVGTDEDKCCDMYTSTILPCTALPLQIVLLREIKKREPKYTKLLLGPRLAIRKGIDVQRRTRPYVAVAAVQQMERGED